MGFAADIEVLGRIGSAIRPDVTTIGQSMSRVAGMAVILMNSLLDRPG